MSYAENTLTNYAVVKTKFRVAVIGDQAVGKSSLVTRFVFSKFPQHYTSTIEDLYSKTILPND